MRNQIHAAIFICLLTGCLPRPKPDATADKAVAVRRVDGEFQPRYAEA